MAILVSDITTRMRQVGLDAENATYYDDTIDLIPAINASVEWLVSVINSVYGSTKFSEDFFSELTHTAIFQTSTLSRVQFNNQASFPHNIWTILAVYPNPQVGEDTIDNSLLNASYRSQLSTPGVITSVASDGVVITDHISIYRPEAYFVDSDDSCKRLTTEEWIENKPNPFSAGSETGVNVQFGYISRGNHSTYKGSTHTYPAYYTGIQEIEIRPVINQRLVAVTYVKTPDLATVITDSIELPQSMMNLLYEKALQFVSYKQGDGTNIYSVTNNELRILTSVLS